VSPELRETLLTQFVTALVKGDAKDEAARVLNSPVAKSGLTASLHFTAGLLELESKQYRSAAEHFKKCLSKRNEKTFSPVNNDIHSAAPQHCLALCLMHQGDRTGAEKAFQTALGAGGHSENVKTDYAKFLSASGRSVDALQFLYQVVTENAANVSAWQLGGRIAMSQPELLEFANDWTREAIKNVPESIEVRKQRAEVLLMTQHADEAASQLQNVTLADAETKALAIACRLILGEALPAVSSVEEKGVSHAFIELYRRFIGANAGGMVFQINERLDALAEVLPHAAQPLLAAVREANELPVGA
jgi:tetratricopeptide (TPR) repeat protein